MPQRITESAVEEFCLEVLENQGYLVSPEQFNRIDTLLPKLMKGEIRIKNTG
ncbi:MAG: hypothetical protein L3J39_18180 [Verrucomicrobiales bacterium]|nr:hypothetical protein [Verrucomicrobiales bacterium]